jgi:formamidopyrimidine-DNA glycosylase
MPELPDIANYLRALEPRVAGEPLEAVHLASPFVLRSVEPPIAALEGRRVTGLRRLGKRIVIGFEDELFLVIHLMIAGRLRWRERGKTPYKRLVLASFDFPRGTLAFTEAGTKKRASLHVVRGEAALAEHDPGGIDPMLCSLAQFDAALRDENHTLKRSLTDPRILSGIGNAYSDEILHRARLSPLQLSRNLDADEVARLLDALRAVLDEWTARLAQEVGDGFPEKVTAFHDAMAVHGRHREPCPVCGDPVQRIAYADSETNYCARCQTGGRLLADRALSRLLKQDWPRSAEELEALRRPRPAGGPG